MCQCGAAHAHTISTWQGVTIGLVWLPLPRLRSEYKNRLNPTPPLCLLFSTDVMTTEEDPFTPEQLVVLREMLGTEIDAMLARDRC